MEAMLREGLAASRARLAKMKTIDTSPPKIVWLDRSDVLRMEESAALYAAAKGCGGEKSQPPVRDPIKSAKKKSKTTKPDLTIQLEQVAAKLAETCKGQTLTAAGIADACPYRLTPNQSTALMVLMTTKRFATYTIGGRKEITVL